MTSALLSPLIPESRTSQTVLIGGAVVLMVFFFVKSRKKYPPGPRGLPVLGNLLALRNSNLMKKMPEWEEQYGPVVTVDLGPMRTVVLNNFDVIQEAFLKKAIDFAGRPKMHSLLRITDGGKDIAGTDYGPTWQLHRKLATRALSSYMKGSTFEDMLSDVLHLAFKELREEKGAFDIQIYTEVIAFNIVSNICFSEMFSKDDKELQRVSWLFDQAEKGFGNGFLEDIFPPLRLYPTKKFRDVIAMYEEIFKYIREKIDKHKESFSPDIQRDFTDAILIAQKELSAEESPKSMAEITDNHFTLTISDIFGGGIDTTRQTLHWAILYIAAHPEVQAKIHEEVDSVMGARPIPLMSDRNSLPYTEAALYECMRIATVSPFSVPHSTTCDTSVGGHTIPKGTFILPNLHAVHHDPKLFEDPWRYKPERFLDSNGRCKKLKEWIPFSIGKRACLAESLAKPELHMIVAALYRNFEIRMPEGVEADLEPMDAGLSFLPKAYKVVITDRLA